MRIKQYYDEFFDNQYFRDFRCLSKINKVCHAPKGESSRIKHNETARKFLLWNLDKKISKYSRFYGGLGYYKTINDYQVANEDALLFNHLFIDFDAHSDEFEAIKKQENDARELKGKAFFKTMDDLQSQIRDLLFNTELLHDSWEDLKVVNDYFQRQGLATYNCFSGSKGFHCRVFFKPVHLNNYNRIVNDLSKNLIKQFNLKTLDLMVATSPSKCVERLPYTFNEKSGLRVIPININNNTLEEVLEESMKQSKGKIHKVDDFTLANQVNNDFSTGLLEMDKQVDIIVAKEEEAKQELKKQRKLNGAIHGKYTGANGLFKDLRILVRFVCGDENLVKSHERYDKYKCVFHEDKSPSAIVGVKNYTCYSENCKINKLNYFDFIKAWFQLATDDEVKEKMVELQELYDEQLGKIIDMTNINLGGKEVTS